MSCSPWRSLLSERSIDELAPSRRQEFLQHLQGCPTCRRAAAEADPTVVFSLLPSETVEAVEVEEIRKTVGAVRRVREIEASWGRRARRGMAVGAMAALVVLAVVLIPRDREQEGETDVPFAGAVGVGSGLVTVPDSSARSLPVDLHVELARSEKLVDLAHGPTMHRISETDWTAKAGERVDRDLGAGYRLRFHLPEAMRVDGLVLEDLQLMRRVSSNWVPVLEADLQPLGS